MRSGRHHAQPAATRNDGDDGLRRHGRFAVNFHGDRWSPARAVAPSPPVDRPITPPPPPRRPVLHGPRPREPCWSRGTGGMKVVSFQRPRRGAADVTRGEGGAHAACLRSTGLFCSLAVLDPRPGHNIDVLSPFIPVLCHSD